MADRKLVGLFPKADIVVVESNNYVKILEEKYGTIPLTYFNMEPYNNPVGIEIEAEKFKGEAEDCLLWRVTEDGSLKKQGVEFISIPLNRTMIDYALLEAQGLTQKLEFGHRTSVHVHCNVSHYTLYQLNALAALYAMFEGCFYHLTESHRRGNSFCYPLVGTEPKLRWLDVDEDQPQCKTTKYCAFNIAPVRRQMSVEFRHLQGTKDQLTLRRWIQLCAKLVYYCGKLEAKKSVEIVKEAIINKKVEKDIVGEVFGSTSTIFPQEVIERSCRRGELWAMTLLTGVS